MRHRVKVKSSKKQGITFWLTVSGCAVSFFLEEVFRRIRCDNNTVWDAGFSHYLKVKHVLVIAGSDSSGGAGIQADIKTITGLGGHAQTALTAVTAQNSLGINGIHKIPAGFITKQVNSVLEDVFPLAVKIGMVYSGSAIKEIAKLLKRHGLVNIVLDPVLRSTSGRDLLESNTVLE